jgi:hypothetical protein
MFHKVFDSKADRAVFRKELREQSNPAIRPQHAAAVDRHASDAHHFLSVRGEVQINVTANRL